MKVYYGPEVSQDSTFLRTYKSRIGICHNVKIPKKIMKRLSEANPNQKYVTLTCAATPGRRWTARTVGRKLSFGWEKFALDNSFVNGDLLLFKYNGLSRFHVEIFNSIGYTPDAATSGNKGRNRQNSTNTQPAAATDIAGNECRLVTVTITADKIERSRMYLPKVFCTVNGLEKFAGKEIAMVGEDGSSFAVKLQTQSFGSRKRLQLRNGLREFFEENDIHTHDQITFELLVDNMSFPKLKIRSKVILVPN